MRYDAGGHRRERGGAGRALTLAISAAFLIVLLQDFTASAQLAERGTEFRFGPSNLGFVDGHVQWVWEKALSDAARW